MEQKIAEILAELCGVEPEEIQPELELFEEGLLDSFAAIQLVMEMASLPRERIATPAAIATLIREKKG